MAAPLDIERQHSGLSAREIAYVLHNGKAHVEKLERLEALLVADPVFNNEKINYMARGEQYKKGIQMSAQVEIIARRNKLSGDDTELLRKIFQGFTSCSASTTLHTLMFIKNLGLLFTEEQQAQWMQLAKEWKMIGCYAQTELGHGSNVRGLETTATYIQETDEFEIHSPTLSSTKWWPGALARTANFGVVYARLILHGKDYGVHNFMVQLRDLNTHDPRPGVSMGDIGPKIGFNNVDNGYCKFNRVRIPREQMAMRLATVDRQGKYKKNKNVPQEILYFTMLQTRMDFVRMNAMALGKAATVSIRYSAVREQGYNANDPKSNKELKVLDYQTQQYRLFPLLAAAYAITFTGNQIDAFKVELSEQIHKGNVSMLNIGHAMSCGLKVLASDIGCAGIETCRRACGGHGYLLSSGLPILSGDNVQTVTAEGENYVLSLQYITSIDQTFQAPQARSAQEWLNPQMYVSVFQQRFLHLLRALEKNVAKSSSPIAGIQNHSVDCYKLSMAYSRLLLVSSFAEAVRSTTSLSRECAVSQELLNAIRLLCHLFALTQLEVDAGEFMESGCVLPVEMPAIRANIEHLLVQIRPHAVVLVDGFNFSDHALNTTLGRYNGKPYEALYESAQHDPVNHGSDKVALHELLIPIREEIARRWPFYALESSQSSLPCSVPEPFQATSEQVIPEKERERTRSTSHWSDSQSLQEREMVSPLDKERQQSGISARELACVVHNSQAHLKKLERFEALLIADPVMNNEKLNYLNRDELYKRAIQMSAQVEIIARRNKMNDDDTELLRAVYQNFTGCSASTALHTQMFIKNLGLLFTEEQKAKWMQMAKDWKMIGCYAQTELGHGSNVRGVETTATYIPGTDEFEIHSPTLSSMKWWPGGLARTANFGVVYARLLLNGKDYGVHNFMVQLRDLDTHEACPGITMGDIGPKIGFNRVDNGYCKFNKVRIPRENMGMLLATVNRQGQYKKNKSVPQEILYFTMLQTRMSFVRMTGLSLGKAATIAIRYSALREQGYDANEPSKELKVLDYQTQQYRLFPLLAAAYGITLTGNGVEAFTSELSQQMHAGNVSMLNVGHAISCGLKVFSTDLSSNGVEICRRACGGHGYLLSSGIPILLGDLIQTVTAEGENYVLSLQTARSILKVLGAFRAGSDLPDSMKYITSIDQTFQAPQARSAQEWLNPQMYVSVFQQRFLHLLRALEKNVAKSSSPIAGIQNHSVDCYKLSMAYSKLVVVSTFADAVRTQYTLTSERVTSLELLNALRLLCHLFALTQLEVDAGEFMESGCVLPVEMPAIRANIEHLLVQIRPHAVVLVDGFNFSDHALNTTLGRYNGKPYEALYESAQHDPVNHGSDKVALHELLIPIREEIAREAAGRSRL
uniref:acyl-CoA oxidase n=1 Tax=Globisporangium ultimum (strain ATCC 200006 / CBS 805.95 / DAOM BR144) TaxID=431595 RepID=K3WJS3_GLOUD